MGDHRSMWSQQQRQQLVNETTYTKLFVGGLAWETQRETMKKYFEQFGEILEAVVISDKSSGRSKGYGFVTFKEPEAAFRACQNPSPVIDGRRANCNLAAFGVSKNNTAATSPSPAPHHQHVVGGGRFRPSPGLMTAPAYSGSASHFHQPSTQPPFPYSAYGYTGGYPHDTMYQMNYYGAYGQPYSPYYPTSGGGGGAGAGAGAGAGGGATGYFHNYYPPYYGPYQYAQSSQGHGFGLHYPPQMVHHFPYLPQQPLTPSSPILSLPPSSMSSLPLTSTGATTTVGALGGTLSGPSQVSSGLLTSEQNSTT